jgi:predicted phage terminase large subunit-like protein
MLGALNPAETLKALSTSIEQDEIAESRERCKSLRHFFTDAWKVIEPATPFLPNWHADAIAEHLQAVEDGQISKLLINVPFRTAKSSFVSVMWPAKTWTAKPTLRWLTGSFALKLAIRDSLKMRRLIDSPWYQARWGDKFQLTSDQNQKSRFENDKTGYRLTFGVDASPMGDGGDIIVCDDLQDRTSAHSEADREHCLTTFDQAIVTRRNDPKRSALVIVMQRLHQNDLSGHVLARGGWDHLLIPMHYDPKRSKVTSIGWRDPRTEAGELMHPARFDAETVAKIEDEIGPYASAGQLEQLPVPEGGAMFARSWFPVVPVAPAGTRWVRGWDLAGSVKKTSPWTAGVKLGVHQGVYYIAHVARERRRAEDVEAMIVAIASQDGHSVEIDLPQDPGSAGKTVARSLIKALDGYVVHSSPETGEKSDRARPFAAQAKGGNVRIVEGPWNEAFLQEIELFPYGQFLDQGDALSRAHARLLVAPVAAQIVGPKILKGSTS